MKVTNIFTSISISLCIFAILLTAPAKTQASTFDICASGCDFQTLTSAFASSSLATGDTVTIGATYASTTESFPLTMPDKELIIDCQSSGATIGTDSPASVVYFNIQSTSTLQNCNFSHVWFFANDKNNFTITNNYFFDNSKLQLDNNKNITITNNIDINQGLFSNLSDSSITNNTFRTRTYGDIWTFAVQTSTNVLVSQNTIEHYATTTNNYLTLTNIDKGSANITFSTNTIATPNLSYTGGATYLQNRSISIIAGNTLRMRGQTPAGTYLTGILTDGAYNDAGGSYSHNTIFIDGSINTRTNGFAIVNWTNPTHVTTTYNLIHREGASSTADARGFITFNPGTPGNLITHGAYNGFSNLQSIDTTEFPRGDNPVINNNAGFMLFDSNSNNDNNLAPFSDYLDVNGTIDIGVTTGTRSSIFYLDASGTIDYVNVHGTTTEPVINNLRSGDTVYLNNGMYGAIEISSTTRLSGNLTITGNGPATIISGDNTQTAIALIGINNSTLSSMSAQNGYGPAPYNTYKSTNALYTYNSATYDESIGLGAPANSSFFLKGSGCSVITISADDTDISTVTGIGANSINVALAVYGGNKITIFAPNNLISSAGDLASDCAGITVDKFISNIYTLAGDEYSYNDTLATNEGISLKSGLTDPPNIIKTTVISANAGLKINNSNNLTINNLTISNSSYGISFAGSASGNKVANSSIQSSTYYDVVGQSSADNILSNSIFARASSSITGVGEVKVYFNPRVRVTDQNNNAIGNIDVLMQSTNNTNSTSFNTNSNGYSNFQINGMPAYNLSANSIAETAGNYNPYKFQITSSGFLQPIAYKILNTRDQTFHLIAESSGGPGEGKLPPIDTLFQQYVYHENGNYYQTRESSDKDSVSSFTVHDLLKLPDDEDSTTQEDTAVYYLGEDLKRHAFPNEKVYFSWYKNYDEVKIISAETMASITLGQNVTYRSGERLVKFISDPTVYIVTLGANLRAIPNETLAIQYFGHNWAKKVHDISDTFFKDYTISEPMSDTELQEDDWRKSTETFDNEMGFSNYY